MAENELIAADAAVRANYGTVGSYPLRNEFEGPSERSTAPRPGGSMPVLRGRGCSSKVGGVRRLTAVRPLHHLLSRDCRRHVSLGVAGMPRLLRCQQFNRRALGLSSVRSRPAQQHEWDRNPPLRTI